MWVYCWYCYDNKKEWFWYYYVVIHFLLFKDFCYSNILSILTRIERSWEKKLNWKKYLFGWSEWNILFESCIFELFESILHWLINKLGTFRFHTRLFSRQAYRSCKTSRPNRYHSFHRIWRYMLVSFDQFLAFVGNAYPAENGREGKSKRMC